MVVEGPDDSHGPIESFEIRMRLDCTLKVNESDWFKPGIEGAIKFRNRLPDEIDLKDATTYLQFHVIDPAITDAVEHILQRLRAERELRG